MLECFSTFSTDLSSTRSFYPQNRHSVFVCFLPISVNIDWSTWNTQRIGVSVRSGSVQISSDGTKIHVIGKQLSQILMIMCTEALAWISALHYFHQILLIKMSVSVCNVNVSVNRCICMSIYLGLCVCSEWLHAPGLLECSVWRRDQSGAGHALSPREQGWHHGECQMM